MKSKENQQDRRLAEKRIRFYIRKNLGSLFGIDNLAHDPGNGMWTCEVYRFVNAARTRRERIGSCIDVDGRVSFVSDAETVGTGASRASRRTPNRFRYLAAAIGTGVAAVIAWVVFSQFSMLDPVPVETRETVQLADAKLKVTGDSFRGNQTRSSQSVLSGGDLQEVHWNPDAGRNTCTLTMIVEASRFEREKKVWITTLMSSGGAFELANQDSYELELLDVRDDGRVDLQAGIFAPDPDQKTTFITIATTKPLEYSQDDQFSLQSFSRGLVTSWLVAQNIRFAALATIVMIPDQKPEPNDDAFRVLPDQPKIVSLDDYSDSVQVQFAFTAQHKDAVELIVKMGDGTTSSVSIECHESEVSFVHVEAAERIERVEKCAKAEPLELQLDYSSHFGLGEAKLRTLHGFGIRPIATRRYGGSSFPKPKQLIIKSKQAFEVTNFKLSGRKKAAAYINKDPRIPQLIQLEKQSEALTLNDDLQEAKRVAEQGERLTEELFGPDSIESTWFTNQLAMIYRSLGRFEDCKSYSEKTIRISDAIMGERHTESAITRANYGLFLAKHGHVKQAKRLLEKAISDFSTSCDPENPDLYSIKNSYANVLSRLGLWEQVYDLYAEILAARERAQPQSLKDLATANNNMGYVLVNSNRSRESIPYFSKALEIRKKLHRDKPLHSSLIRARQNLATGKFKAGEIDEAIQTWKEVLKDWQTRDQQQQVKAGPSQLIVRKQLAHAYILSGEPQKAKPLLDAARQAYESFFPGNMEQAGSVNFLDGLYFCAVGDIAQGVKLLKQSIRNHHQLFTDSYPFLSASQRQRRLHDYRKSIDYLLSNWDFQKDSSDELHQLVSQWKNSLSQRRVSLIELHDDADGASLFRDLQEAAKQVAYCLEQGGKPLAEARRKKSQIERRLSETKLVGPTNDDFGPQLLAPNQVLFDFFEYHHYPRTASTKPVPTLLMFVISKANGIHVVNLGDSESLTKLARSWNQSIQQQTIERVQEVGREFGARVLEPVSHLIPKHADLVILPDGPVNEIPFAAIPVGEKYLVENHTIRFAQFQGDLTPGQKTQVSNARAVLVGGFDYPGALSLPMAKVEVAEVKKRFQQLPEADVVVIQNESADFPECLQNGFDHIHVASHADSGMSPVVDQKPVLDEGSYNDPLNSVFLRLPDRNVYGSQISLLDLRGVELVCLSACNTNAGEGSYGDVFMSLTTSFRLAGCRSVVGSLWRVEDYAGKKTMTLFYDNLLGNDTSPSVAMREAQLKLLANPGTRHPIYWAGWKVSCPAGE